MFWLFYKDRNDFAKVSDRNDFAKVSDTKKTPKEKERSNSSVSWFDISLLSNFKINISFNNNRRHWIWVLNIVLNVNLNISIYCLDHWYLFESNLWKITFDFFDYYCYCWFISVWLITFSTKIQVLND